VVETLGHAVVERLHGAAVAVPAQNDLADAERSDGELDGCLGGIGQRRVGVGDDVADRPRDEQVAGAGAREQVRHDATVAAGDEQHPRLLASSARRR
jgi:hypothetical protein